MLSLLSEALKLYRAISVSVQKSQVCDDVYSYVQGDKVSAAPSTIKRVKASSDAEAANAILFIQNLALGTIQSQLVQMFSQ